MRRGYFTPPVLIILAIIIFAVAILIAINADFVKRLKKEPLPTPSPTTQQPSPTADETANWKTHISSNGKLRFMYPTSWETQECVNLTHFKGSCFFSSDYQPSGIKHVDNWEEEIDFPKSGIAMSVVTSDKENFGEALDCGSIDTENVNCEEIQVDGNDAVKVIKSQSSLNTEPVVDVRTTVIRNDNVYQILFTFLQSNQVEGYKIADQILSTFQFLD